MKQSKLRNLKDNQRFHLSKRKGAVTYTLLRKDRKQKTATYQSNNSTRTYERDWNLKCFLSK